LDFWRTWNCMTTSPIKFTIKLSLTKPRNVNEILRFNYINYFNDKYKDRVSCVERLNLFFMRLVLGDKFFIERNSTRKEWLLSINWSDVVVLLRDNSRVKLVGSEWLFIALSLLCVLLDFVKIWSKKTLSISFEFEPRPT